MKEKFSERITAAFAGSVFQKSAKKIRTEITNPATFANLAWGTYYSNRYYFSVRVHKTRDEAGLSLSKHQLTETEQRHLQWENYPVMLHEFLHYLHDLSTLVGQASLYNQVLMQSIFANYAAPGLATSESLGCKQYPSKDLEFHSAFFFNKTVYGSGILATKMHQIRNIGIIDEPITGRSGQKLVTNMIGIPHIHYVEMFDGSEVAGSVKLGNFYLYECIAYEMDRFVSVKLGHHLAGNNTRKGTEYTVGRMVAQFLFPQIDPNNIARLAVISLQSMNCGMEFIKMVKLLKSNEENGITQDETIKAIKRTCSSTMAKYQKRFDAQVKEYPRIFKGRTQLEKAYNYIADISSALFKQRLIDPCFDLELIYEDKVQELLNIVQLCDFIYVFDGAGEKADDPKFNRDFIGTALNDMDLSIALKALVSFDHYFSMHYTANTKLVEKRKETDNHCCPFYSTCPLPYRKDHPDICKTKPWRVYEMQYAADKQYCWYGTGVLETKGISFRTN